MTTCWKIWLNDEESISHTRGFGLQPKECDSVWNRLPLGRCHTRERVESSFQYSIGIPFRVCWDSPLKMARMMHHSARGFQQGHLC
jgi:hypothetical protein